jgi:hypothetical protein
MSLLPRTRRNRRVRPLHHAAAPASAARTGQAVIAERSRALREALTVLSATSLDEATVVEITALRAELERLLEERRFDLNADSTLDDAITEFLSVSETDVEARRWLLGDA